MVKRLFSVVAAVAMFSVVALGQAGPAGGFAGGPDTVVAQQSGSTGGPGAMMMRGGPGGPMQVRTRQFEMRVRGPMGAGPMMWRHRRGMGQWWRNPAVAQRIGLNEQQKQQLEKISQDGRLKMIDLRADLEKQQVILQPMMRAFHPDEAQVLAQIDKVSQARAAVEKARVQTMLASRSVLTEEQWTKLKDMRMPFHHTFMRRGVHRPMMPQKAVPPSK